MFCFIQCWGCSIWELYLRSLFSATTVWVPAIKHRPAGLAAGAFKSHQVILAAYLF